MKKVWWFGALITFLTTLYVNYLAAAVGINSKLTGAISDAYPTLFTPAGYVFSIWSLIYIGLIVFLGYSFFQPKITQTILPLFTLSNLFNAVWILCWHYGVFGLSVLVMVGLLGSLIVINQRLNLLTLKPFDRWMMLYPFQLYLGWISVATIANISVYLYSIGWGGWGVSDVTWTMMMTGIAALLGIVSIWRRHNLILPLVVAWALWGIGVKLSQSVAMRPELETLIGWLKIEVLGLVAVVGIFLLITIFRGAKK